MKKIGDELEGFFESFGIKDEKNYLGFIGAWNSLIGQDLSSHCRPTDIRGTVLLVAVDHPGWMTRIRFEEKKMLKKIRLTFPQLGINALGFILVEKLPKPAHISLSDIEKAVDPGISRISSGRAVDTNLDRSEMLAIQEPGTENNDNDFHQALKNLKAAMSRKSSNDR